MTPVLLDNSWQLSAQYEPDASQQPSDLLPNNSFIYDATTRYISILSYEVTNPNSLRTIRGMLLMVLMLITKALHQP